MRVTVTASTLASASLSAANDVSEHPGKDTATRRQRQRQQQKPHAYTRIRSRKHTTHPYLAAGFPSGDTSGFDSTDPRCTDRKSQKKVSRIGFSFMALHTVTSSADTTLRLLDCAHTDLEVAGFFAPPPPLLLLLLLLLLSAAFSSAMARFAGAVMSNLASSSLHFDRNLFSAP
jgi:hypothetical protein